MIAVLLWLVMLGSAYFAGWYGHASADPANPRWRAQHDAQMSGWFLALGAVCFLVWLLAR